MYVCVYMHMYVCVVCVDCWLVVMLGARVVRCWVSGTSPAERKSERERKTRRGRELRGFGERRSPGRPPFHTGDQHKLDQAVFSLHQQKKISHTKWLNLQYRNTGHWTTDYWTEEKISITK